MELPTVVLYLAWLASLGLLWLSLTVFIPGIARDRYVRRVEALHDRVDDAVLDGQIPDCDPVQALLAGLEVSIAGVAPRPSVTLLLALHLSRRELNDVDEPSFADLAPQERRFLHAAHGEFGAAIRSVIIWGSPFWFAFAPLVSVVKLLSVNGKATVTITPAQLADEFVTVGTARPNLTKRLRKPLVHAH